MCFPFLTEPALDDLDTIEVRAIGIAQGADHERGRFAIGCLGKITAHWYAALVTLLGEIGTMDFIGLEVPAGKDAHQDSGAGSGIDFLARHGVPNRFSRVLARPNSGEPRCSGLPVIDVQAAITVWS